MSAIDADIWVLTETRASVTPNDTYHGLHSPPHPTRRPDLDERWVSVWSRWPLRPTEVAADPRGSVSAIVDTPVGGIVVYGTVLPWANEKGSDGKAGMWQVHYQQIERQGDEWKRLRMLYPDLPLVVAGDFNQDRDRSGWYGTRQGRDLLTRTLTAADTDCLTEEDVVAAEKLRDSHLVDHIAASRSWVSGFDVQVSCWEKTDHDGVRLSDHPTVAIDMTPLAEATVPLHGE